MDVLAKHTAFWSYCCLVISTNLNNQDWLLHVSQEALGTIIEKKQSLGAQNEIEMQQACPAKNQALSHEKGLVVMTQ